MNHPFDQAITLQAQPDVEGSYEGASHPAWANMVGPFGGITAPAILNAVILHPKRLGEPLAMTVNFCAAVQDGAYQVQATPVRTNRSTQHWTMALMQSGETVITATAVTAVRRESWSAQEEAMPRVNPPESYATVSTPLPWTQRYQMRFITGPLPAVWEGAESDSLSQLWVRDADGRAVDFQSLTGLCDVFFPRIYVRRAKRVPIGTVSLTTYFHCDAAQLAALSDQANGGYVLGQARAQCFRNGFFDQTAQVWAANGALLASTHQTVYYRE